MFIYEDDFVEYFVVMSMYDMLLFFINIGKVYCLKGYEVFEYGCIVKGILIINLFGIES